MAVAAVHRKSCAEHTGAASPLARARCDHQATEDCPPPCGHSRGLRPTRPAAADEVTCGLVGGLDYDRGSSPARRPWRAKLPHTQVACRNPWMQSRQMGTDASVGPAALQPRDLEEGLQRSCPHLQTGLGGSQVVRLSVQLKCGDTCQAFRTVPPMTVVTGTAAQDRGDGSHGSADGVLQGALLIRSLGGQGRGDVGSQPSSPTACRVRAGKVQGSASGRPDVSCGLGGQLGLGAGTRTAESARVSTQSPGSGTAGPTHGLGVTGQLKTVVDSHASSGGRRAITEHAGTCPLSLDQMGAPPGLGPYQARAKPSANTSPFISITVPDGTPKGGF